MSARTPTGAEFPEVGATVQRARQLFTETIDARVVAEVTAELRVHLDALIPACRGLMDRIAVAGDRVARARCEGVLMNAERRLLRGCGENSAQALTYMRLLAEDAAYLWRQAQQTQQGRRVSASVAPSPAPEDTAEAITPMPVSKSRSEPVDHSRPLGW